MGIMPPHIYMAGRVGIVGRSGTLGYEAASQMKALGDRGFHFGGDRRRSDQRQQFQGHPRSCSKADPDTDAVMMIGEIGGPQEAEAAAYRPRPHDRSRWWPISRACRPPRAARWAMRARSSAPSAKAAQEKVEILTEAAGITVAPNPSAMGETMARVLGRRAAA